MNHHRTPILSLPPPGHAAASGHQASAIAFISRIVLAAIAIALAASAIVAAPSAVLRVLGSTMLLGLVVTALIQIARRLSSPSAQPRRGESARADDAFDAPDFGMTG